MLEEQAMWNSGCHVDVIWMSCHLDMEEFPGISENFPGSSRAGEGAAKEQEPGRSRRQAGAAAGQEQDRSRSQA